jgi:hypothetical protein
MKNVLFILALITITLSNTFGQDIITLKSGEKLEVKITKIGKENIEFRPYKSNEKDAVIVLDKFLMDSYKFEFQDVATSILVEKVTNISVEDLYDSKNRFAIKTQPIAAILGDNYKFSYEQSIAYNRSIETEIALRLTSKFSDAPMALQQFNITSRYKMFYRPSSLKMTDTGKNPLSGIYLAPVGSIGTSSSMENNLLFDTPTLNSTNVFVSGMIDLGYQIAIDKLIVDSFIGVGVSLNSQNRDISFNNSHTALNMAAVRCGFRVGMNFEK